MKDVHTQIESVLMNKLIGMIDSFNLSITLLNKSYCEEQSLYLFLTYLDQLGWLTSPKEFSTGADFQNWLDTYCDLTKVRCTSIDLWNTRCSLLHMGTAEHKRFNNAEHFRLSFYQNKNFTEQELTLEEENYYKPTKLVDISVLYNCINNGISNFLDALELDSTLKKLVLDKCNKRNDLLRFL